MYWILAGLIVLIIIGISVISFLKDIRAEIFYLNEKLIDLQEKGKPKN